MRQHIRKPRGDRKCGPEVQAVAPLGEVGIERQPLRRHGSPGARTAAAAALRRRDRAGREASMSQKGIAVSASCGRSHLPESAELNTCAIATLSSDEATYGRSFTYSAMLPASPGRRPRTRPIGSTSKASTAVQRSGWRPDRRRAPCHRPDQTSAPGRDFAQQIAQIRRGLMRR